MVEEPIAERPERGAHRREPGLRHREVEIVLDQEPDRARADCGRRVGVPIGDRAPDAREERTGRDLSAVVDDGLHVDVEITANGENVESVEEVVHAHAPPYWLGDGSAATVPGVPAAPVLGVAGVALLAAALACAAAWAAAACWASTWVRAAPCGTEQLLPCCCAYARAVSYCFGAPVSSGGTRYCVSAACTISENTGADATDPYWFAGSSSTTIAANRGSRAGANPTNDAIVPEVYPPCGAALRDVPVLPGNRVARDRRARAGAVAHHLAEHLNHRRRGLLRDHPCARRARDRLPVTVLVDGRVEQARRHGHAAVRERRSTRRASASR